jgi:hypothetical protein
MSTSSDDVMFVPSNAKFCCCYNQTQIRFRLFLGLWKFAVSRRKKRKNILNSLVKFRNCKNMVDTVKILFDAFDWLPYRMKLTVNVNGYTYIYILAERKILIKTSTIWFKIIFEKKGFPPLGIAKILELVYLK